jgi:hypothetical protein
MMEPVRPEAVFTRQGVLLTDLLSLLDCRQNFSLSIVSRERIIHILVSIPIIHVFKKGGKV